MKKHNALYYKRASSHRVCYKTDDFQQLGFEGKQTVFVIDDVTMLLSDNIEIIKVLTPEVRASGVKIIIGK